MLSLEQQVKRTIGVHHLLGSGDHVLLALSGGSDSVALLRVLLVLRQQFKWRVSALHVNHRVRGLESERDEQFVRELCERFRVALRVEHLEPESQVGNLEAVLRKLRYGRLVRHAGSCGAVVATGHTLNDQAETLLLKLVRGAGPAGLAGIHPRIRKLDIASGRQISIVRPLLQCTRQAVLSYLEQLEQSFREDSSNLDLGNDRNWVRHRLIPRLADRLNPRVVENLGRSAEISRNLAEFTEKTARELFGGLRLEEKDDLLFEIDHLNCLPLALRNELFRIAFLECRGPRNRLDSRHLEALNGLLTQGSGREITLPGGWSAIREFGRLRFHGNPDPPFFEKEMRIPGRINVKEVGKQLEIRRVTAVEAAEPEQAVIAGQSLTVRNRRPGDRLEYSGRMRRLKTLLQEKRIPRTARNSLLVVESDGRIVWVEGLGPTEGFRPNRERQGVLVEFEVKHLPD